VSLLDFGIAVPIDQPLEEYFVGTPEYCAPEMLATGPIHPSGDLYSFGLMLYELIEGGPAWDGSEPEELYIARTTTPVPPIRSAACPEAVKELIYDLLKPYPAQRPESAATVMERLSKAVGLPLVIETSAGFQTAMESLVPHDEAYRGIIDATAPIVVLEVDDGHDASVLVNEVGDLRAVRGVRVVRLVLDRLSTEPLGALEPALEVFRRLRYGDEGSPVPAGDIAGAAMLLTRMHSPTLLVLEELQRADKMILKLLSAIFTGAGNYDLRIMATVRRDEAAVHPELLETFLGQQFIHREPLASLAHEAATVWLGKVFRNTPPPPMLVDKWLKEAGGSRVRLAQIVTAAFDNGDVNRCVGGYDFTIAASDAFLESFKPADVVKAPTTPPVSFGEPSQDDRMSVLRMPLPRSVIERFFGERAAQFLLHGGRLVETASSWVTPLTPAKFAAHHQSLPTAMQLRLNDELAEAIVDAPEFPGQHALAADTWELGSRPARAVPHVMMSARENIATNRFEAARAELDRARKLLKPDPTFDTDRLSWREVYYRAEIALGRGAIDVELLGTASSELFEVGTERAHLPTMRHALVARMDHAAFIGAWTELQRIGSELVSLDPAGPTADDEALSAWAETLEAWSVGQVARAADIVGLAVKAASRTASPAVLLRLVSLAADLVVSTRQTDRITKALETYRDTARRVGDAGHTALAGVLAVHDMRERGRPSDAIKTLERVSVSLGRYHGARVNARLQLELARCHLGLGLWRRAREHADRAFELAERGSDQRTSFGARLVRLTAELSDRPLEPLMQPIAELAKNPPPQALSAERIEASWLHLQVRLIEGDDPAKVGDDALALARTAHDHGDVAWALRAAETATRAALRGEDPRRAVRLADWLRDIAASGATSAVPTHLIRALRAKAHYRMKWFGSAQILSRSSMESLRTAALGIKDPVHRRSWLAIPSNAIVGSGLGADGARAGSAPILN
ncbi:MAG: hypothetical protein ACI9MR_004109, partial [Myxococcota bacterium]